MDKDIQIIEKPDWVSWDDIHDVLDKAHVENRAQGINMSHPSLPGDEICKEIGDTGVMMVALDGQKVVGTAAIIPKNIHKWYAHGRVAYMCLAGVLPSYQGLGVYRKLMEERERIAKTQDYHVLTFDTHVKNTNVQTFAKNNGYKYVRFFKAPQGHNSIVMAKWLDGCPFTDGFIRRRFKLSKLMTWFFFTSGRINNKKWERVYLKIKRHFDL